MKRPGLLRFIPFWPVILIILLALLWHQRVSTVTWVLNQIVIGGDIEDLTITPKQLDLDRSLIASMQFKASLENQKYHFFAENIEFTYRFRGFTSIALQHVKLDRLKVTAIDSQGTSMEEPSGVPTLHQLIFSLNQLQNLDLPIESLTVHHLDLSLPEYELTIPDGAISLTIHDQQWEMRVTDGPRYFVASDESGKFLFTLGTTREHDDDVVRLEVSPQGSDKGIAITTGFESGALGRWLTNYPITASFGRSLQLVEGHYSISAKLTSRKQDHMLSVEAKSDQIRYGNITASGFLAHSEHIVDDKILGEPDFRIETSLGTEITASSIEFDAFTATDLKLDPVGYLEVTPDNVTATLTEGSNLSVASLRYEDISVQSLELEPVITLSDSVIQVRVDSRAHAKQISIPDLYLSNLSLAPKKSSMVRLDLDDGFEHQDGSWTLESTFQIDASNRVSAIIETEVSHLDADLFRGRIISYQPEVSLEFDLPSIEKITAEIVRDGEHVEAAGTVTLEQISAPMGFSISHHMNTSVGDGRIWNQSPMAAIGLSSLAQSTQLGMPDELLVEEGAGDIEMSASWAQDNLSLSADLALTGLSGLYQEVQFRNLDLSGTLQVLPELQSRGAMLTKIDSLEYGVELENLSSVYMLEISPKGELPKLDFDFVQGELFSSSFSAEDFTVDLNHPDTTLDLRVQNLDIEQVVATQGIEGLEATGRVDGNLPVTITSEGITIENGIFWNHLGGGNIVYLISDEQAAALDNPLTDLVITALRDFRYRVLTAETNYHPNGDLYMNFHLEGISPQLDPNRPVHLNINSEQNVLSLLQSLSYSEGVNKALDKQIQEKFE